MPLNLSYTPGSQTQKELTETIENEHKDNIKWLKGQGFVQENINESEFINSSNPAITYLSRINKNWRDELRIDLCLDGKVESKLEISMENDFLGDLVKKINDYAREQFSSLSLETEVAEVEVEIPRLASRDKSHYDGQIKVTLHYSGKSAKDVYNGIKGKYDEVERKLREIKPPTNEVIFKPKKN